MYALTIAVLHAISATAGSIHALIYKRDPRAAAGWVAVCALVPFAGPILYFLFGINRVRSRAQQLRAEKPLVGYERANAPHPDTPVNVNPIQAVAYKLSPFQAQEGNHVAVLHNGEAAYPAMLAAIKNARQRIILCTYILNHDSIGIQFIDALESAIRRDVDVKVLIDGVGELYSRKRIRRELHRRGIQTARFLPFRLFPLNVHINMRNHRKMLVIDGASAFIGGINISDHNVDDKPRGRRVSDVHFQLEGPIATDLETLALSDWYFATSETPNFPAASYRTTDSQDLCRVIPDGPDENLDRLAMLIQGAVSAAQHNIDIMTPYFLPSRELISALLSASLRGVRIRIVLPGINNLPFVKWASQNQLGELASWNIEIYEQPGPFCHSKLFTVDDEFVLVGSANLDPRSLRLNFELGVEVISARLSNELTEHFEQTIAKSKRITAAELDARPLFERVRDSAAALFSPYL